MIEGRKSGVALLVGAGDAIGAAVARRFAAGGHPVCVARRSAEKSQSLVQEIVSSGGVAHAVSTDVRNEEAVQALFAHVEAELGSVEVCLFNAGANVKSPLTIRWNANNFTAPGDGHYEVFLDRDPQPPGETLQSYFTGQTLQFIWTVDQTSFKIPYFPLADPNTPKFEQVHHEVTVILVDTNGRRIGETSGFVEFNLQ